MTDNKLSRQQRRALERQQQHDLARRTQAVPPQVQMAYNQLAVTEERLLNIINTCAFIAIPGVPVDTLRIQLRYLSVALEQAARRYIRLLEPWTVPDSPVEIQRTPDEWSAIGAQIKDFREAIAAAIDEEHPDDGAALRRVLDKYMKEEGKALHRQIRTEVERLEQERQTEIEQAEHQAAEKARLAEQIEGLTSAQRIAGELKWAIRRVIAETGESQKPAARILLDRLKSGNLAGSLIGKESELYHTLDTWLENEQARQRIGDLFTGKYKDIPEIPWEAASIRL